MFANFHESRIKISQVLLFFIIFQILNLKIKQRNILVNFDKTLKKLLASALSHIFCCNFFISTASCYILFVYFMRRKELQQGF